MDDILENDFVECGRSTNDRIRPLAGARYQSTPATYRTARGRGRSALALGKVRGERRKGACPAGRARVRGGRFS